MRDAFTSAGVSASQLAFMHIHGVGTSVGDTSEIFAVNNVRDNTTNPLVLANHKGDISATTIISVREIFKISDVSVITQVPLDTASQPQD